MTDTKAFDLIALKPGDEVGIERCRDGAWEPWSANRVVAIHGSLIELEGDEWYQPNGRHAAGCHATLRLAAPTDKGRHASLYETVCEELNDIKIAALLMDFPTLRRLKAWIDARGGDDACES